MTNQNSSAAKIHTSVIYPAEMTSVSKHHNATYYFMPLQSLSVKNMLFTQSYQGGDEDDPIVPTN
ncbi:hypothetical protein MEN41_07410 [Dolichospermum sp. ST_con]|nr:hypothetical protein [Dolichospermum sp. ST_con]MDD1422012.1 hypothetical protein [Dolichospermum sp. ST_sed1]MDD1427668.1 hypothetical protein [Dolichospermum sp. ST_sed9]MDD1433254.1 hypothetical protein [Dolichospermum sp. ST_sed6]MDD1437925.1 hypothetical protein [Dolichospermum sp. ST_sed10]MDD1443330.1 hypothetical protein [Dolichospermum sp. ST_sed3]MDD1449299.1 hypothetical protein [Dolichospermum sp. ST_sed8]MDD1457301.1 hypothetical protein [Dolichospermum sp. ST_sed7]MDD146305